MTSKEIAKAVFQAIPENGNLSISKTAIIKAIGKKEFEKLTKSQWDNSKYSNGKGKIQDNFRKLVDRHLTKKEATKIADKAKALVRSITWTKKAIETSKTIANSYHTGHSMGCTVEVFTDSKIKNKFVTLCRADKTSEYARSCKYSATHGHISIYISRNDIDTLEWIKGVPTIFTAPGKTRTCRYLAESGSKSTYSVDWVNGYFDITTQFHAETLEEIKEARQNRLAAIRRQREGYYPSPEREEYALNSFVGYKIARKYGCAEGIKAFIARQGLEKSNGYSLKYLYSLNDTYAKYYLDMIKSELINLSYQRF